VLFWIACDNHSDAYIMLMDKSTPCQCEGPGYCEVHSRNMCEVRWNECHNKAGYYEVFAEASSDALVEQDSFQIAERMNPGTTLTRILAVFGVTYEPECECGDIARKMDRHGAPWCRNQAGAISDSMMAEADRREWRVARWRFGRPILHVAALTLVYVSIVWSEAPVKRKRLPPVDGTSAGV